ncbi:hypothetical protein GUITHDRAFT_106345 [Guillardia theta CCMP2712]|uniref:Uncharacterized protein n=1 Tax=Guillardia theta (strain CCMP2712) TaxID=905079 RepID=L1JH34_GUITC|nr:hypothetical protein GUITHDRAFT_106345 [Guillardia theta CCMP2712]EKX47791.1 hypothetical protein GUITHDRAFT_106345 [Guillardia theta CCMP2712]|eukprot:XP_005834771.1 hypothetical protein GUITHDRAFT_106345 [Guillardia theta CCMP2712]
MGNNPSVVGDGESSAYVGPSPTLGGIGVVFIKDKDGEAQHIDLSKSYFPPPSSLHPFRGDVLRFVDGADLRMHQVDGISMIAGYHGSRVRLGFERGPGTVILVDLVRDSEFFPDQLMLPPPGFDFPSSLFSAVPTQKTRMVDQRVIHDRPLEDQKNPSRDEEMVM